MKRMVAIVEDNPAEAELLESYFQRYAAAGEVDFQLRRFASGTEFLSNYHPIYDLVMMDVNLPGCNGMEAAAALRKLDEAVTLIFVTSMSQYAVKGYEVDALDFLVKPVSYQHFSLKLKRALNHLRRSASPELLIPLQNGFYRMPSSHIKYIEVINHSLIYHTTQGNIDSTGKMSDLEAQLPAPQFVRCNRCYLVNLAFVRAVRGSLLVVDTDELQISRPKRAAVLETLNNYLGGGFEA